MPTGRGLGLAATLLVLLAMSGGCQPSPDTGDYVRIQVAGGDAGEVQYAADDGAMNTAVGDAGSDAGGSSADASAFDAGPFDAGPPTTDAGTLAPDAGMGAGDASTGLDAACAPSDCGVGPADVPTCFDGQPAQVVCQRWIDRSCRWQLVCGM